MSYRKTFGELSEGDPVWFEGPQGTYVKGIVSYSYISSSSVDRKNPIVLVIGKGGTAFKALHIFDTTKTQSDGVYTYDPSESREETIRRLWKELWKIYDDIKELEGNDKD